VHIILNMHIEIMYSQNNESLSSSPYRLLIVDDNESIHQDFIKIFDEKHLNVGNAMKEMENCLFGSKHQKKFLPNYQLDFASQGEEALEKVRISLANQLHYSVIFMDILMPPGWDGVETTKRIWAIDPDINVVLCTAYADYSWEGIVKELGVNDKFLILKKPFENIEVRQIAACLTAKWTLNEQVGHQYDRLSQEIIEETKKLKQLLNPYT
jgi:CheY-like chemotaxis protein